MNIGYGKFGKSIAFNEKRWGLHGGDAAPVIMIVALAKANPDVTFYLLGRSDYKTIETKRRLELFPNQNVINVWDKVNNYSLTDYKFVAEWLVKNEVKIDGAIYISGPTGSISIPDNFVRIDKKGSAEGLIAKTMVFSERYAGPMIYATNENDFPFITLCEDPRYYPLLTRDMFRRPTFTLGQFNNAEKEVKHHTDYTDQTLAWTKVPVTYSYVETIFAMGETPYNSEELFKKKSKLMNLYLNQGLGAGGMDRGPIVKEWVLDQFPNKGIMVHGKWQEPYCDLDEFTSKGMSELIEEMEETKYTLIIPVKKGWVTSKFWKMLHFGILPFMHPTYDTQKSIPVDDFLRVESPADYKRKIEYLESNPDKYKELYDSTMKLFRENFYSGKSLITEVYNSLYESMGLPRDYQFPKEPLNIDISSFKTVKKLTPLF